jgi:hypothetical protein
VFPLIYPVVCFPILADLFRGIAELAFGIKAAVLRITTLADPGAMG